MAQRSSRAIAVEAIRAISFTMGKTQRRRRTYHRGGKFNG
jgi:hypothetical protein